MSIRTYHHTPAGTLKTAVGEADIKAALEADEGLLWVDITGPTEADGRFLADVFKLHPLTVEDCVSDRHHPPKVEEFDGYLFVIVHGINYEVASDIIETAELCLLIGPNFVVSTHHKPLYSVGHLAQRVENGGRPMRRGAAFLAHGLIDALVDNILPAIDRLIEVAELIEEEGIRAPGRPTLEHIMKVKRSALRVHRIIAPQREVLSRMSRGEFSLVPNEASIFYRDIYDHMLRLSDLNQSARDVADNALSSYLASVAIRQNETMKILSAVAAIFLPLTLIAGIYGMNFEYMPELEWPWAYFAVLGLMALIGISTAAGLWARGWIAAGGRRACQATLLAVDRQKLLGYLEWVSRRTQL